VIEDRNVGASNIIPHNDINSSQVALGLPLDEKDAPIRHKSEYATHSGAAPGKGKTAGEMFVDDDPKKPRS